MKNVLVKNRAARPWIFRGRDANGIIKCINILPTKKGVFQEVPKADWDLVKDQALVRDCIREEHIEVKDDTALEYHQTKVAVKVDAKPVSGDKPATVIVTEDDNVDDTDDDNDESPASVDTLMESLDGKNPDEIKTALKEYAKEKHDIAFGNNGIDSMVSKIKEVESE